VVIFPQCIYSQFKDKTNPKVLDRMTSKCIVYDYNEGSDTNYRAADETTFSNRNLNNLIRDYDIGYSTSM
jgi:hypothetical protein